MPRRYSRINSNQSRKFAEHRRRRAIVGLVAAVASVSSWLFVISRVAALPYFAIDSVQVYGADPGIAPSVRSAAVAAIQGSYLGLLAKSDELLYPRSAVAAAAVAASPRIVSAAVSRDGGELIVSVSEKTPAALVCPDLPNFDQNGNLSDDDDCYAADASGLLFEAMPAASSSAASRYYIPDLSGASLVGMQATSTAEFQALQSFLAGAKSAGIMPEAVLMKDGGEYELYAAEPSAAASSSLIVIYFDDRAGLSNELSDLQAFWSHMVSSIAPSDEPQSFQYIDLRYGSNVFYR